MKSAVLIDAPSKRAHARPTAADLLASPEELRLFAHDALRLRAADAVHRAMLDAGITRAEVASRIGKSRSYVTQVLSGSRNMTLKTLADLLWACGHEVSELPMRGLGEMMAPPIMTRSRRGRGGSAR